MGKAIEFDYNGTHYVLEYTKGAVKSMESNGFALSQLSTQPETMIGKLWDGSFLTHHRFVNQKIKDEIFEKMGNKEELLTRLIELYEIPLNSLVAEPEGETIGWE